MHSMSTSSNLSTSSSSSSSSRTVFINPNFKNTHINPSFLVPKQSNRIHINPAFLEKYDHSTSNNCNSIKTANKQNAFSLTKKNPVSLTNTVLPITTTTTNQLNSINKYRLTNFNDNNNKSTALKISPIKIQQSKIISKSRTKIVRESASNNIRISASIKPLNIVNFDSKNRLIKIGTKKLIRSSLTNCKTVLSGASKKVNSSFNSNAILKGKYKLDRRNSKIFNIKRTPFKKHSFVTKYALSRISHLKENLPVTRVLVSKRKLLRIGSSNSLGLNKIKPSVDSVNKKLKMVNINGVLYKSTKNKLQKTDLLNNVKSLTKIENDSNHNSGGKRSIYIRGDKFTLDKSGHSLTRISSFSTKDNKRLKRIDIGGLTYVAKSQNVFVRTNIHKTRNHLSSARQKSIHVLSRKFVKSNIPCPILKKVGKCAAHECGRCPNIHDKIHINICSKFLKGECNNKKCLLSHEVTLSKMPTCKFFLQGCCVRDDCPYLHKKLNQKTEICTDFLNGFCHLAEKCVKRHEFLCPDYESTGKCEKPKCLYCRKKEKDHQKSQKLSQIIVKENNEIQLSNQGCFSNENKIDKRYFTDHQTNVSITKNKNLSGKEVNTTKSDDEVESDILEEGEVLSTVVSKRPKLGELPAFIPL